MKTCKLICDCEKPEGSIQLISYEVLGKMHANCGKFIDAEELKYRRMKAKNKGKSAWEIFKAYDAKWQEFDKMLKGMHEGGEDDASTEVEKEPF